MREVDQAAFAAAHTEGAIVIDVREPGEYVDGHVPGARMVPLSRLPLRLADLPRGVRIYVICEAGKRSTAAVSVLTRAGIDAVSVAGGTSAWKRAGRPIVHGTRPTAA